MAALPAKRGLPPSWGRCSPRCATATCVELCTLTSSTPTSSSRRCGNDPRAPAQRAPSPHGAPSCSACDTQDAPDAEIKLIDFGLASLSRDEGAIEGAECKSADSRRSASASLQGRGTLIYVRRHSLNPAWVAWRGVESVARGVASRAERSAWRPVVWFWVMYSARGEMHT